MATAKKTPAKKVPAKKVAAKKSTRRRAAPEDEPLDDEDDELPAPRSNRRGRVQDNSNPEQPPARPGMYSDRSRAELKAALEYKLKGLPVFAFPSELPEEQRPYWIELVNSRPHDYFNQGDIPLLKLYCRAAFDIDRLDREIKEEGDIRMTAKGSPVVNPKIVVRSIAESRLMGLASKLRAQPAARYEAANDRSQGEKKKKADAGAKALEESHGASGHTSGDDSGDEEDGLLAGSGSRTLN